VGFLGCQAFTGGRTLLVKPQAIVPACGDGNFQLSGLRWSSWGASGAAASGTAHQNDCTPNCAAGHFHAYPATVTLSALRTCAHGTRHELTLLAWRFTHAKPAGVQRSGNERFPCR
jgi:hypothetical protein